MWIRDDADVKHVGRIFSQGSTCTLWCDAVSLVPKKENREWTQQSQVMKSLIVKVQGNQKRKENQHRKEHVEEVKSELREKHGDSYTPLQYTLWVEMICVGTHESFDNTPQVQMFTGKRKQKPDNEMSTVFTELAKSVVKMSYRPKPVPTLWWCSKLADLRSKYIHQMRTTQSL